jgi:hypothetical protein
VMFVPMAVVVSLEVVGGSSHNLANLNLCQQA